MDIKTPRRCGGEFFVLIIARLDPLPYLLVPIFFVITVSVAAIISKYIAGMGAPKSMNRVRDRYHGDYHNPRNPTNARKDAEEGVERKMEKRRPPLRR